MKPQLILELEKELDCVFELVECDEIIKWHTRKTFEYSVDNEGNINGLAMYNADLAQLPNAFLSSIYELRFLENLNLPANKITDISALKELTGLKKLYLGGNWISDISAVENFEQIETLYLSSNNISDISPLQKLKSLKQLTLGDNQISDISALQELHSLQKLDLQLNPIKTFPEWMTEFPEMDIFWKDLLGKNHRVSFYDNPFENIPLEIVKQGKGAISNFFKQIKKEQVQKYLFEAKLLVIGEGGVGKTTFANKLRNVSAAMPPADDSTMGIDVSKWNFKVLHPPLGEKTMYVNIWDFGGQNLYKGTHQMFFSEKSLYVLIDDTREEKTDFAYWMNTVEQLARNGSKVLIVTNKKHSHVPQIDKTGLLGHFGDLIAGFVEIDLKKDEEEMARLQNMVKNYLQNLPEIGSPLPASWVNIREDLFLESKNFISYDRFVDICTKHHSEIENIHFLSDYFNRIGVFTHYYDDDLLCERIYLNSNWLVHTVYQILNHAIVKDKKGRLSKLDVKTIWSGNELFNETIKLARLMHRFGLMYEIPEKQEYVVPVHLQADRPYENWRFDGQCDILQFVYEFDKYMPKGILSRLIVALHRYIADHNQVWQKGVNIVYNDTQAEITETYDKSNKYLIKLYGNEKKELLGIINSKFDEILSPFQNLQYEKLVPCICSDCRKSSNPYFYKYSDLLRRREKGKATVECEKSYDNVSVNRLLDGIELVQINVEKQGTIDELEFKGRQEVLVKLMEKKFFLEKDLILAFDSEKKFALQQHIKEIEEQIKGLR